VKIRSFLFASVPSSQLSFGFCPVVGFFFTDMLTVLHWISSRADSDSTIFEGPSSPPASQRELCHTDSQKMHGCWLRPLLDILYDDSFLFIFCITSASHLVFSLGAPGLVNPSLQTPQTRLQESSLQEKRCEADWSWVLGVRLIDEETENPFKIRIVETSALPRLSQLKRGKCHVE